MERNFSADHPNQIWVSDFTYFRVNGNWLFFCMILDLYSRKVIGYRVSQNSSTDLVTATFRKAFKDRGSPEGLIFHSDLGKQYTSKTFTALLEQCGVEQSFPRQEGLMIMRWQKFFLPRSKKKRRIDVNTPRNRAFAKAWRNMFNFTIKFGPTGF